MRGALAIASMLYGAIGALRNQCYDRGLLNVHRSRLPVISIGNVTAGGNAKTPLAIYLVRGLKKRGYNPVLLLRGYRSRNAGPLIVDPGMTAADVGDEALMLSRSVECPVVISRRRVQGALLAERNRLGDLIVLDDGLQHRALARELDIITANVSDSAAAEAFVAGDLLPLGMFRERRGPALARAGLLVLAARGGSLAAADYARIAAVIPEELPIVTSQTVITALVDAAHRQVAVPERYFAFCGVANPQGFLSGLARFVGRPPEGQRLFGDHHQFTARDLEGLKQSAAGAMLICTEKDLVRLPSGFKAFAAATELTVEPESLFWRSVEQKLPIRGGAAR